VGYFGSHENTGLEMRTEEITGVENAGLENDGLEFNGLENAGILVH